MESKQQLRRMLNKMAEKWPSDIVARSRIEDFTGGLLTSETLKYADCRGEGIDERFYMGRKVVYPVQAVVDYIMARAELDINANIHVPAGKKTA